MAAIGLEMKSQRRCDPLSKFAQLVRERTMVRQVAGASGLARATRANTDSPPYVRLRATPARGSLRDLRSE